MLLHTVSLGGVAVVGSKDIMAVSRAWGHSFASLRRLQLLRSLSSSTSWSSPAFEPIVQQNPISSRHVRFMAHAAALEESPEVHPKKGGRLSRAERYVLVENFVLRHKDAHEGKWPTLTTIMKEIGGSRVIVKDIVEELEKNSKVPSNAEPDSRQSESLDASKEGQVENGNVVAGEAGPTSSTEELKPTNDESELVSVELPVVAKDSALSGGGQSSSPGNGADGNIWSTLREYENSDNGAREAGWAASGRKPRQAQNQAGDFDSYDTDSEDDENEESPFPEDGYEESKDVEQQDASELRTNHSRSSTSRPSLEAVSGENYGLFIRFLPLAATEADLRAAFEDCGEIVRAQAMAPKGTGLKFTYGFVDFSTAEGLSKALRKDKVFVKGSPILTEACSSARRGELKHANYRKPEFGKKGEGYRSPDRNPDGKPSRTLASRYKRVDSHHLGIENGTRSLHNPGPYLVAVEGLPYPMPISAVEKMLSTHGDIARSELAREEGGTYSAHVEFKTEEAKESALASSRVYLGGRWCRVTTGEPILTTVVRLSNVGNASENFILQRCGKFGRVDNIVQRKEGVVDIYYHPSEKRNMRKILDRLGEVNADFKRWHANLAPKCSLEEIRNSPDVQEWAEAQKDKLLDHLTGTMKLMIIDLEDLRDLVEAERSDVSTYGKPRFDDRSSQAPKSSRWS